MSEKTVIIHMGLAKTGSTSIQQFLASNQARLAEQGVLFPVLNREEKAHRRQIGMPRGPQGEFAASLMIR